MPASYFDMLSMPFAYIFHFIFPLQNIIVNMNNAINKLEQTVVETESIDHSEIDQLFS
jgi:hypothetical protein